LDLKGARRLKALYPKKTVTIFISPPSLKALKERIEARCLKTKRGEVRKRLALARNELATAVSFDYCLVNKSLHQATGELKNIVLEATC
jgi:guanylate kinase